MSDGSFAEMGGICGLICGRHWSCSAQDCIALGALAVVAAILIEPIIFLAQMKNWTTVLPTISFSQRDFCAFLMRIVQFCGPFTRRWLLSSVHIPFMMLFVMIMFISNAESIYISTRQARNSTVADNQKTMSGGANLFAAGIFFMFLAYVSADPSVSCGGRLWC